MKTTKEVLLEAAALIEQPGKWTRGVFAKDANGNDVDEVSPEAVCFCALGAIGRITGSTGNRAYWDARNALKRMLDKRGLSGSVSHFNDEMAKDASEVATLLREAAEKET